MSASPKSARVTPEVLGTSAERRVRAVLRAARAAAEDDLLRQDLDDVLSGELRLAELTTPRRAVAS
ncbi:MAG TPA: hypothetical protein VLS51_04720 [Propionibacteriaceae bacterium]|nr:hypothetical protein [Propionibacteriaceae bacterium]